MWMYVEVNVLGHAGHYRRTLKGVVWDGIIRAVLFLSANQ